MAVAYSACMPSMAAIGRLALPLLPLLVSACGLIENSFVFSFLSYFILQRFSNTMI
jgi:hypothetical protein